MSLVQKLVDKKLDIIGDIHGEVDALKFLLSNLGYDKNGFHLEDRKVIFVGDLCDRGPDSTQVIKIVKNLIEKGNAQAILGNHEINLLQNKAKDGAGWYFEEQIEKDKNYHPFNIASNEDKKMVYEFLVGLPLALERDDLRIVHAAWDNKRIEYVKKIPLGQVANEYIQNEENIDNEIRSSGLLDAYKEEQKKWGKEQASEKGVLPFLETTAQYNLAHQMRNPLRVLTSGVEEKATEGYYASGKWRFVQRCAWWDSYQDDVPVIVGHYWRKLKSSTSDHESLFNNIEAISWHGKKNNVFCVDYSVGGRFKERNSKKTLGGDTTLAALRWPENELMLEHGEVIKTTNFRNSPNSIKKMKV